MRSKASLFLMEQLVMVLVFALCAAVCLRIFVGAEQISAETARRDEAVAIAQNAAELLKAGSAAEDVENNLSGSTYRLQIEALPEEISGLQKAEIAVFCDDTELFSLTVGYQEVEP